MTVKMTIYPNYCRIYIKYSDAPSVQNVYINAEPTLNIVMHLQSRLSIFVIFLPIIFYSTIIVKLEPCYILLL